MNKKVIIGICIGLFIILVIIGIFAFKNIQDKNDTIDTELMSDETSPDNVRIEVLKDTITNETIDIRITDKNKEKYGWGAQFSIQKYVDEEWKDVPYLSSEDLPIIEEAYTPDENNQIIQKLEINKFYEELTSGTYRIVKPAYYLGEYVKIYSDKFVIE